MLIPIPAGWPYPVIATVAVVTLAGLDLAGAWAAKEAAVRESLWFAGLGAGIFLLLFWVYMSSLRYAELAVVTTGWIVVLQVGVLLLGWWRYGEALPPAKWAAVGLILVAMSYLLLGPSSSSGSSESAASAVPSVVGPPAA